MRPDRNSINVIFYCERNTMVYEISQEPSLNLLLFGWAAAQAQPVIDIGGVCFIFCLDLLFVGTQMNMRIIWGIQFVR